MVIFIVLLVIIILNMKSSSSVITESFNISNEAIQNVSSLYNNKNMIVDNLLVTNGNGNIDIGPKNADWGHIYTDRPSFAFNKQLTTIGNTVTGYHNGDENNTLWIKGSFDSGEKALRVFRNGHVDTLTNQDHGFQIRTTTPNPYMTLSRNGEWGHKSWYIQNVANGENPILRLGVHDEGGKMDLYRDGTTIINGRNILAELDALRRDVNNSIKVGQAIGVQSSRGGWLIDNGGWSGSRPDGNHRWESMKIYPE